MTDQKTFEQIAFFVDVSLCTGCKSCMIACKDKNDLHVDINWRRVVEYNGGTWSVQGNTFQQNVYCYYVSVACNHCREPLCVKGCPTTAMHKGENGIVAVDQRKCVGCSYCEWICPYGAPKLSKEAGHMTKCDFCRDYLLEGKDPACVAACPTRTLKYGEVDELEQKEQICNAIAPLTQEHLTRPSLVLNPHRNAKPSGDITGYISNPEEI